MAHLDRYEGANLDSDEYEALSPGARREVERQLRKRDRQQALASGRTRPGLLYDEGSFDDEEEEEGPARARRRRSGREGMSESGMELEEVRWKELVELKVFDVVFWNHFESTYMLDQLVITTKKYSCTICPTIINFAVHFSVLA